MFHFLNASAIENRHLALPGHKFNIVALDGNPVPVPAAVDVLMMGPGERIDAWVEMNQPGVWIMGAPEDPVREGGLGIVIEYANQHRTPQWIAPAETQLGLHDFRQAPVAARAHRAARHGLRKNAARRGQVQQLHGERQVLSARPGVCAQTGTRTALHSTTAPTTRIRCICTGTSSRSLRFTAKRRQE